MLSTILAIHIPSALSIVATLIGLLILWIIVSIPVYFGAKLLVGARARFSQAMIVTLAGPIIFALVLGIGYLLLAKVSGGLGSSPLFSPSLPGSGFSKLHSESDGCVPLGSQ